MKLVKVLKDNFNIELKQLEKQNFQKTGYSLDAKGNVTKLYLNGVQLPNISFLIDLQDELKYLSILEIAENIIDDISILSKFTKLTNLDLRSNNIQDITPLFALKKLQTLDVSDNNLINIEGIDEIKALISLTISRNDIRDLSSIGKLNKLHELHVSSFKHKDFKWISSLNNLIILELASNGIESIDFINNLKHLKELDVANNAIVDISPIANLNQLTNLNISGNRVNDISSLSNLTKIKHANIGYNKIESFKPLLGLKYIEILFIDNNGYGDFTPLEKMISLKNLSLEKNNISDLTFISNLSNLEAIWLSGNQITDISPLKELKSLDAIDLRYNPLSSIPSWITDFKLKIRWEDNIARNAITFLDNPIEWPPVEVVKQGNEAIKRYFTKIEEQGIDYIYEAKLTLVGDGSAGKTSLQVRLMNPKASLPKKESRTRGIKIYNWKFRNHKNKNYVAHIWDFGGQDVYYPVHRFFLTENSVFVLLASTRQNHHNFDYWIPTIYQFGSKSPIILGQTCHDGNKIPWNDLGHYVSNDNFNIIKTQAVPYFEVNLPKRNEGLSKLRQTIINQIVNLPHYGKGVPKSWIQIRNRIASELKNSACITFDSFRQLCLSINPIGFVNIVDVEDCAKFLHSIGVILWYYSNDELKNWVVLQPEWAMNAVYKIIDDGKIQKRRGNILSEDFDRLWKDDCYLGKHSTLKKMLEVFKIAFPKKHKKQDYLIPARLLSMPDEAKWPNDVPYLRLEYKYLFMPKGLVNQVSAELSRYIYDDESVWNNAVRLMNQDATADCLVEEDFYNRKIIIKAKGSDARGLIMIVMNALRDITDEYKGVKPEIRVPCICTLCNNNVDPNGFSYNDLIRWLTQKESARVTCNESNEILSIEDLLYNIGLAVPHNNNLDKKMSKIIKIFLASSNELDDDREQFEIFINRENKRLHRHGIFIDLNIWEDTISAMSMTRSQDEYNKLVIESDILLGLFHTKVGKFTLEEFEIAVSRFKTVGKPLIYTFFKDDAVLLKSITEADALSKYTFINRLKELEHFPSYYKSIEDLKYQFKMQLDKILDI